MDNQRSHACASFGFGAQLTFLSSLWRHLGHLKAILPSYWLSEAPVLGKDDLTLLVWHSPLEEGLTLKPHIVQHCPAGCSREHI
jgi:hypothetical protein